MFEPIEADLQGMVSEVDANGIGIIESAELFTNTMQILMYV